MPKLGESVVEGTVVRWLKRVGEPIAKYEPLAEVITDKVNAEIPSPEQGTVARLLVEEGKTVPVGTEIAIIQVPVPAGGAGAAGNGDSARAADEAGAAGSATASEGQALPAPPDGPRYSAAELKQRSSPLVRRLAREHTIDLARVPGSGSGGRVTKEDMLAYIEARRAAPAAVPAEAPVVSPPVPAPPATTLPAEPLPEMVPAPLAGAELPWGADEEVLPASPVRRAIAAHMVRSLATAPHTWTYVEVDVSGLARWREQARSGFQQREGFDLSYVPFVCKALVETLREHPALNSTWRDEGGGQIVLKKRINLGVAVALEENLIVPVVHDADRLSVAGLAHALNDLVTRARAGKLTPADVQGGTFTLNNTGALGSILSQPIINQPQAAIVTMEAITRRVVVTADDALAIRPIMNVCLSFDHRILDGLQVGRFMQGLKRRLEAMRPGGPLY
jgi:2-oxoisovalerate dehydrogenase E2 component (dihydrolipoyl transacylase)